MRATTKLTIACNVGNLILAGLILLKAASFAPEPVKPQAPAAVVKYVLVRYDAPQARKLVTCEQIVEKWEGYRYRAYKGKDNRWTVGIGWTHNVKAGDTMSHKRALQLVHERCEENREFVHKNIDGNLSQQQIETLASFAYNTGREALRTSTLAKHIQTGRNDLALNEFRRWSYVGTDFVRGLYNRRVYEAALFAG